MQSTVIFSAYSGNAATCVASHAAYSGKPDLNAFTVGEPTTIKKLEIWKLQPTNQGFREAQKNHVWEPNTK